MLLMVKFLVEGSCLFVLYVVMLVDVVYYVDDVVEWECVDMLVSFLILIFKVCQIEWGIENIYNVLQCFGGYGYICEYGMEQFVCDVCIIILYEGIIGIQVLDLIGCKIVFSQGVGLKLMLVEIEVFVKVNEGDVVLVEFIILFCVKVDEWGLLILVILQCVVGNFDELGVVSFDYLFYLGYVVLVYWWVCSVVVVDVFVQSEVFKQVKCEIVCFYFVCVLLCMFSYVVVIQVGVDLLMVMDDVWFGV